MVCLFKTLYIYFSYSNRILSDEDDIENHNVMKSFLYEARLTFSNDQYRSSPLGMVFYD